MSLNLIISSFVLFYPYSLKREALVCSRSLARIAGSNTARGMNVASFDCSAVSGRDLCDGPFTLLKDSYRSCVSECDFGTWAMRRPRPTVGVEP